MVLVIMPRCGVEMIYCTNNLVYDLAMECARGSYQRSLVEGASRWSGSDINNQWGARYAESRKKLHMRLVARGMHTDEVYVDGKVFLVVGATLDEVNDVDADALLRAWR